MSNTAVQPSFSTIRCKTLNIFIKVCYSLPVVVYAEPRSAAMQARRAFDPFSIARSRPPWSYRLIFFVCHSYATFASRTLLRDANLACRMVLRHENTGGVGVFFPFWNSTALPAPASSNKPASPLVAFLFTDHCPLTTARYSVLLFSKLKPPTSHAESTLLKVFFLKNLKPFEINTFGKQGEGSPLWLTNC